MAQLNTHGLKMTGIKAASGETRNYGSYSARYVEIFYNRSTGEIWTVFQCSLGHNSWTVYHDQDIIKICETSSHMTMQEIADAVYDAVRQADFEKAEARKWLACAI